MAEAVRVLGTALDGSRGGRVDPAGNPKAKDLNRVSGLRILGAEVGEELPTAACLREQEEFSMKVDLAPGWKTELDRGPDWLFVRLFGPEGGHADASGMADSLFSILRQEMKTRLLLECDEILELPRDLIVELLRLQTQIDKHGGVLRLCGLLPSQETLLRRNGFEPLGYRDRSEAVLGQIRPGKPR